MKKADRQKVFDKYGGRCAYCGCELSGKWHADHIQPVVRLRKKKEGYWRDKITKVKVHDPEAGWPDHEYVNEKFVFDRFRFPERDTVENSVPACTSCNVMKSSMDLGGFRTIVSNFINSLNKYSTQYKFAKRFGLIKETGIEVKFYFELLKEGEEKK